MRRDLDFGRRSNKINLTSWNPMHITALYAGLLAPVFMFLSLRVIRARRDAKVGVGDGGDKILLRRMRVQANFAEYTPFTLLLMALAESLNSWGWLLHLSGLTLLTARMIHAYGVSQSPENFRFRVNGMAMTFTSMGVLAAACIYGAVMGFANS
jgi:uncharacterized protein